MKTCKPRQRLFLPTININDAAPLWGSRNASKHKREQSPLVRTYWPGAQTQSAAILAIDTILHRCNWTHVDYGSCDLPICRRLQSPPIRKISFSLQAKIIGGLIEIRHGWLPARLVPYFISWSLICSNLCGCSIKNLRTWEVNYSRKYWLLCVDTKRKRRMENVS